MQSALLRDAYGQSGDCDLDEKQPKTASPKDRPGQARMPFDRFVLRVRTLAQDRKRAKCHALLLQTSTDKNDTGSTAADAAAAARDLGQSGTVPKSAHVSESCARRELRALKKLLCDTSDGALPSRYTAPNATPTRASSPLAPPRTPSAHARSLAG